MNDFATPSPQINRDGWGRPLIMPVGGGKPISYTRATTFVSCLEDTTNLDKWKQRKVAQGLSMRPDLLLAISALDDPDGAGKKEFNKICEQAMEAAASKAAATTGTALHKFTERLDLGQDVGFVPAEHKADLQAYQQAMTGIEIINVETFVVLDDLKVAGTFDRLVRHNGVLKIADVKTGSIDYGMGKIAMQLAVYAHGNLYDTETFARTPLGDVDLTQGIVIHLPAGKGTCDLVPVDIAKGWAAIPLAGSVRAWRSAKWPVTPLSAPVLAEGGGLPEPQFPVDLAGRIASATTVAELLSIWEANQSTWTDELTQIAGVRKALLAA